MASDGCDEVAWKGQAFPYLMHRPDPRSHNYGEARNAGVPAPRSAHAPLMLSEEHCVLAQVLSSSRRAM